jgi:hypothetical protein
MPGRTPPPYQYIILHSSCKNRIGVAISQAVHAATEVLLRPIVRKDTRVVVLEIETAEELEDLSRKLMLADIHHVVIREPDEPYKGNPTAIGIEPCDQETVRPFVHGLKILKDKEK